MPTPDSWMLESERILDRERRGIHSRNPRTSEEYPAGRSDRTLLSPEEVRLAGENLLDSEDDS